MTENRKDSKMTTRTMAIRALQDAINSPFENGHWSDDLYGTVLELVADIFVREPEWAEDMSDDELRQTVVDARLDSCFGDGLEREYATCGQVNIGNDVTEMSRKQLVHELVTVAGRSPE